MDKEIKICGTTSMLDLDAAVAAGANAVGIICAYRTDRQTVGPHRAAWFVRALAEVPDVKSVLLPRLTDPAEVVKLVKDIGPDRVQLGENEDPRLAEALCELDDRPKIAQVFHISETTTPNAMHDFMDFIDYAHFDTFDEMRPGGTGKTHDWERSRVMALAAREAGKLTILAGGLTPDNVGEAIRTVEPDGVDVQSGVKDTMKAHNPALVSKFVEEALRAFNEMAVPA